MYRFTTIVLVTFMFIGCSGNEFTSEYYLNSGSFSFVRFIDGKNILLVGWKTRYRVSFGLYKARIDNLDKPLSFEKLGSTRGLGKKLNGRGVITARDNIGDNYLIMSGDTKYLSIRGTGLYSIKDKKFNWDPPVNGYYEFLGTSKNKQSLLLKTEKLSAVSSENTFNIPPGVMLPVQQSSSIVEYDLKSKKLSTIFESKDFQRPLKTENFFDLANCSPYSRAAGSPDGETIIIIGRKLNDVCRLYLLNLGGDKKPGLIELKTLGSVGGLIKWSEKGDYFIMACGPSVYCRYSPKGKIEKVLDYNHKNYFMADYDSSSDLLLLQLRVKEREDIRNFPYFVLIKYQAGAKDYTLLKKLQYVFN